MLASSLVVLYFITLFSKNDAFFEVTAELPWKKGICKNEMQEKQPDFQPEKFFRGRWYVGQSFGTLFNDVYKKCIMLDAVLNERTVNLTVYEYIPIIFSTLSRQVTFELQSDKTASFTAQIPWLGMLVVPLPVDILATDYNNYAMLYSCSPALGLDGYISEIAFIIRRTRGDLSHNQELRNIAWRNGIKYEEFLYSDNNNCPNV